VLSTMTDPHHRFDKSQRSSTHEERETMRESARNTYRPRVSPAWLQHDRQVLKFFAHFQEPVHESPKENCRTRECVVHFYLEDGTMMIDEPKVENSGIPQGVLVKRHRVPNPDKGGALYTTDDLGPCKTIEVYSKRFRITACDDFTQAFYEKAIGTDASSWEHPPVDAFRSTALQEDLQASARRPVNPDIAEAREYNEVSIGGARKNHKLKQFVENDRKVLCFRCFWEDPTRYGSRLYYMLHYYLADDCVEIHESLARNSGRDPFPVFWRKAKLRKNPHVAQVPGLREPPAVFFKPADFLVGQKVHVMNRELTLYDCDDFTRQFFRDFLGHEQKSIEIVEPPLQHVKLSYPPHTGFGQEDDSLGCCVRLTARPPRRDVPKILSNSDNVLRFEARMANGEKDDMSRRFVVAVYIADDTVAVWEPRNKNSGFTEGKFASRACKKNPETGTWFAPQDFFVGATVTISAMPFHLVHADKATFKMMEQFRDKFAVGDVGVILRKIVPVKDELVQMESLHPEQLHDVVQSRIGVHLCQHELITLSRAFPGDNEYAAQDGLISGEALRKAFDL